MLLNVIKWVVSVHCWTEYKAYALLPTAGSHLCPPLKSPWEQQAPWRAQQNWKNVPIRNLCTLCADKDWALAGGDSEVFLIPWQRGAHCCPAQAVGKKPGLIEPHIH